MDALLNTTEAAAMCGVTTRQFRAWRLKWPDVCVPREEKGRLQFYAQCDVEALIGRRKKSPAWSAG